MGLIVYFSSKSGNTRRFVEKLGFRAKAIPLYRDEEMLKVHEPYILVVPTYAAGDGSGAVHKQVIRFLNDPENRSHIQGVIAGGNKNFGRFFAYAGDVISARCKVPLLYRFEMMGTEEDIIKVKNGVEKLWHKQVQQHTQHCL